MDEPRRFFDRVSMGASERHTRRRALRILGLGAGATVAAACAPAARGGRRPVPTTSTTSTLATTPCTTNADCAGTPTDCAAPICSSGTCAVQYTPYGTQIATGQVVGDCHSLVCDGSGNVVLVVDDSDVSPDGNECTSDVCTNGSPSHPASPVGTVCSAGVCNGAGQCVQCIGSADCGPSTECAVHTCTAGVCGQFNVAAGTACTGGVCDGNGLCVAA
jgi:hypothetical protein